MALSLTSVIAALVLPTTSWAFTLEHPACLGKAPLVAARCPPAFARMPWDPEPEKDDSEAKEEKKIDLSGLFQVMSMGAGAPMLGDLKKTNFEKPESEGGAALQFELEANNCKQSEPRISPSIAAINTVDLCCRFSVLCSRFGCSRDIF